MRVILHCPMVADNLFAVITPYSPAFLGTSQMEFFTGCVKKHRKTSCKRESIQFFKNRFRSCCEEQILILLLGRLVATKMFRGPMIARHVTLCNFACNCVATNACDTTCKVYRNNELNVHTSVPWTVAAISCWYWLVSSHSLNVLLSPLNSGFGSGPRNIRYRKWATFPTSCFQTFERKTHKPSSMTLPCSSNIPSTSAPRT